MIIYVESNFVLELARQQEEFAEAEQILSLAEAGSLQLAYPALAIMEPLSTIRYYGLQRSRLVESMQSELRELARLQPHKQLAAGLEPLVRELLSVERGESYAVENAVHRLLVAGRQIALTQDIFNVAVGVTKTMGLSIQDAIVYSSVLADLASQPEAEEKCFVSRNPRDFFDPTIVQELRSRNCRYIARFRDALDFLRNRLG